MRFYLINLFFLKATYILAPFFYLVIFLRKIKTRKLIEDKKYKILIFQTQRIGDMVCATPVFREIKKNFPDSHVTALGSGAALGIINANPHIDKIMEYKPFSFLSFFNVYFKLRKSKFTHSINFFPSLAPNILPFWLGIPERICTKTAALKITEKLLSPFINRPLIYKKGEYAPAHHLKLLSFLGIANPDPKREIFIPIGAGEKVEKYFNNLNLDSSENFVGISVNCDKKFREWPKEKFIRFINLLQKKHDVIIFFVGGTGDKDDIEQVRKNIHNPEKSFNLAGVFDIRDTELALFKKFSVFISVDTGPLYIADALGVPTIDIIGPSDPKIQSPQGKTKILAGGQKNQNGQPIKPCAYVLYPQDCKKEDVEKLMDVSPEEVLKAYEHITG